MQAISGTYNVAIIGGGLAGLALSIQLSRKGYRVILFEKERYPFHKVCGEYISMEAWNFLESLGLPLSELQLPQIRSLVLTAPNGTSFKTKLPLGGFGISRFTIDALLANLARENGVTVLEETKVDDVKFDQKNFSVSFSSRESLNVTNINVAVCCGAFGKRSNLDVKWKRNFISNKNSRENNYVGVKYHVKTSWPDDLIGLHNFSNGYCGISKIEEGKYCLCYLTTAENLKSSGASIKEMEKRILYKNPNLKSIFLNCDVAEGFPLTISQISFSKKPLIENKVLMLGDAAGMITPLCGNGMSMALHASKMVFGIIDLFLQGKMERESMEHGYQKVWNNEFATRLQAGRILQGFFGSDVLSNAFVSLFKTFPFLATGVIRKTHGKIF